MEAMFERAVLTKLRFDSPRGALLPEDLIDLPLRGTQGMSLNELAQGVNRQIKALEEESFVDAQTFVSSRLELRLAILVHVIKVKLDHAEQRESLEVRRSSAAKLRELIARKKDSDLEGESIEDLEKRLKDLDA